MSLGVLLIAAGSSSRLGSPKGLLPFKESTLIEHQIQIGLGCKPDKLVVVLGSNREQLSPIVSKSPVEIVENLDWEMGMGGSIRVGIEVLKHLDCILLLLLDQPLITTEHLLDLARELKSGEVEVVATLANDIIGPPCAFSQEFYSKLLKLEGDQGARNLLRDKQAKISAIQFNPAGVDIDTVSDYDQILSLFP